METEIQEFGVCNLSAVPLRAEASDKSEMVSQLLFGDCFSILEKQEKWVRIRLDYDDYEGWIDVKQYVRFERDEHFNFSDSLAVLGPRVYHTATKESTGEKLYLLAGSSFSKDPEFRLANEVYRLEEDAVYQLKNDFSKNVSDIAHFYLNAPYLWGGKSIFGIDCSGFTQIVFKQLGMKLKRDAWQQAEQGTAVDFLQEVRPGDLAFFDNPEGRIVHVGIMLSDSKIIHASGKVRIDTLDNQGIYNAEMKRHTHTLRIIKRFSS